MTITETETETRDLIDEQVMVEEDDAITCDYNHGELATYRIHVKPGTKKTAKACSCPYRRRPTHFHLCSEHFDEKILKAFESSDFYLACYRCEGEMLLLWVDRLR